MNRFHLRPAAFALAAFTLAAGSAASAAPLPRSHVILTSAVSVDADAGTATLPLHRGTAAGKPVWYIVTDSSDAADAKRRGVVHASLIAEVGTGCAACVAAATETNGELTYAAAPDFSPERRFKAGPTGFPPADAAPGATAPEGYTPFQRVGNVVINAPIVATGDRPADVTTHRDTADRVVAIDTAKRTVTLLLARGFAGGKRVLYLSTEASDAGAATIERATFVPSLKARAGIIPIDVIANGAKQGLGFVALHGNLDRDAVATNVAGFGSPLNILTSFPTGATAAVYSPLWNVIVGAWKPGKPESVLTSKEAFAAHDGDLGGPSGSGPAGPAGFVVNCPVVAYVDEAP